jgi:hypothetical protein
MLDNVECLASWYVSYEQLVGFFMDAGNQGIVVWLEVECHGHEDTQVWIGIIRAYAGDAVFAIQGNKFIFQPGA